MHGGRPVGWFNTALEQFDWRDTSTWGDRFPPVRKFSDRFPEAKVKARVVVPPRRPRKGRPAQGPVTTYVIGIEGSHLVKIGYTSAKPNERRIALQTGLPFDLTLLWSAPGDFETRLHDMFDEYRVRGEWFDLTNLGDPVEVVRSAVAEIRMAG
jgi:hypothetical protein